jgi:hypothetical protein
MTLLVSSGQCYFLGMLAFGLLGFIQGWRRAVILTAFTLAGVLFLLLKGGSGLANIIFVRLPVLWQEFTNPGGSVTVPNAPSATTVFYVTLFAFLAIVVIGYFVGQRAFDTKSSAGSPYSRLIGIIPGLITGYFFITYISDLFNSAVVSFGVSTPGQSILDSSLPVLFVVVVVVLILALITTRVRKAGGGKK